MDKLKMALMAWSWAWERARFGNPSWLIAMAMILAVELIVIAVLAFAIWSLARG